jgi:uroporphyrinogen decarboxylase
LRFALDPDHRTGIHRRLRAGEGESLSLHGEVTSPLDYFLDLFGFAEGFLALAEEPARSKAVLERYALGVARLAADEVRAGVDAVKISSPYAGAGFLSPRHYREFVLPYEAIVAKAVREAGAFAYIHTCGAVGDRLELLAESGAGGIECLDPPPLGNVELEDALNRVGARMFIKGNVDPVHTLLFGSLDRIATDVRRRLSAGGPRGGYILSTACSIAPRTPAENVAVMAELAETYKPY